MPTPSRSFAAVFAGVLLALVMGAALAILFVRDAKTGIFGHLATALTDRTNAFNTSVPVIVEKIQSLNRL